MSALVNRFSIDLQSGKNAEETAARCVQALIRLVDQLNAVNVAVVVGPGDNIPDGMQVGQPVIDWSSGTSILKVWNGAALV